MKRLLSLFICLSFIFSSNLIISSAEEIVYGDEGYYHYYVSEGKAIIDRVNCRLSGDITLPSTIGGYPVESVSFNNNCYEIVNLIIPDGIKKVKLINKYGDSNDNTTYALKSIQIGSGVSDITLNGCTNLENITLSDKNKNYILENNVLYTADKKTLVKYVYKKANTSFTVPSTVEDINSEAFFNATSLKKIDLNKAERIGRNAFKNCKNISSLIVPETVHDIDLGAFSYSGIKEVKIYTNDFDGEYFWGSFMNCKQLRSVCLSNGIEKIPNRMFYGCTSLQAITIPNSVKTIETFAFKGCTSLKSVKLSINLNNINRQAFEDCKSLNAITLPQKLKYIQPCAFNNCKAIKSITIPVSVKSIGFGAFFGCSNLIKFLFMSKKTKIVAKNGAFHCGNIGYTMLPQPSNELVPMDMKNKITIYAPQGSYAEQYAKKYKIEFKAI